MEGANLKETRMCGNSFCFFKLGLLPFSEAGSGAREVGNGRGREEGQRLVLDADHSDGNMLSCFLVFVAFMLVWIVLACPLILDPTHV